MLVYWSQFTGYFQPTALERHFQWEQFSHTSCGRTEVETESKNMLETLKTGRTPKTSEVPKTQFMETLLIDYTLELKF